MSEAIKRVEIAIEEFKKGNMVIMMDDEGRENEGDLVYPASLSTPEKVNFLAKEARGLICTPLSKDMADKFKLYPMVSNNTSNHTTAFTVSVESKECDTGISAHERDMTIKVLANPTANHEDIVTPGHIFPLIAKDGGTLIRSGHTEGSLDLCKLAGFTPISVICEIMNEDGTMARENDLKKFAKLHKLKIVYIADIIEYRLKKELLVKREKEEKANIFGKEATKITLKDDFGNMHFAFKFKEGNNIKYTNIQDDIELFTNNEKYNSFFKSIELLEKDGGYLIYINNKKEIEPSDQKSLGLGVQISLALGIKKCNLLTSSKSSEDIMRNYGIEAKIIKI